MDQKNYTIRLMTENDLEQIMVLKNLLGWNQTEADWRALINFDPNGCFAAVQKDTIIGTATTTSYGSDLGWIGMVIVHPEKRNLGIGRELLKSCLQYLNDSHISCIKLDATPMGKKLYISFGFRDEYALKRFKGICRNQTYDKTGIGAFNLNEAAEFDKKYFIADRKRILERLFLEFPGLCFQSFDKSGKINGFVMVREGQMAYHLGPLISESEQVSVNLLNHVFSELEGKEIIFDIGEHHESIIKMLLQQGFEIQRDLYRMCIGNNPYSINNKYVVASSSAEKG